MASTAPDKKTAKATRIIDSFLRTLSSVPVGDIAGYSTTIKTLAGAAREKLQRHGIDVTTPGLSIRERGIVEELRVEHADDDRIVSLALMAHGAWRTGGDAAAVDSLFLYLSSGAGFELLHGHSRRFSSLPKQMQEDIARIAGQAFGDERVRLAVEKAVLSLRTEQVAGVVAYFLSGRCEHDVDHWEGLPAHERPALATWLQACMAHACTDARMVSRPGPDGELLHGTIKPCSLERSGRLAAANSPDRLVLAPDKNGGVANITMALAFSGNDSDGQYFSTYLDTLDLARNTPGNPLSNKPLRLLYLSAGTFVAAGQDLGAGVAMSRALEAAGVPLADRQDLACLPLLSVPLQWKSEKVFSNFFRFNPLVVGTSTLRWHHLVENAAADDDATRGHKGLCFMAQAMAGAVRALDAANAVAGSQSIKTITLAALEKVGQFFDSVAHVGGGALNAREVDHLIQPLANHTSALAMRLCHDADERHAARLMSIVAQAEPYRQGAVAAIAEKKRLFRGLPARRKTLGSIEIDVAAAAACPVEQVAAYVRNAARPDKTDDVETGRRRYSVRESQQLADRQQALRLTLDIYLQNRPDGANVEASKYVRALNMIGAKASQGLFDWLRADQGRDAPMTACSFLQNYNGRHILDQSPVKQDAWLRRHLAARNQAHHRLDTRKRLLGGTELKRLEARAATTANIIDGLRDKTGRSLTENTKYVLGKAVRRVAARGSDRLFRLVAGCQAKCMHTPTLIRLIIQSGVLKKPAAAQDAWAAEQEKRFKGPSARKRMVQ